MTIGFFFSLYMASCSVAAKPFTVNASNGSDIHILGDTESGVTIATVAIGDINGDRVNDIILAGRGSSHVAVIFGRKTFSKVIQFSETIKPDIRITSIPYNHQPNPLLHIGDLNGDGIEDLFLPHANGVQVYFGRTHWPKHINAEAFPADLYIQTADLVDAEHTFGYSFVTTGDINGDGKTDILFTRTVYSFPPKPRVWKTQPQPVSWVFLGRKQWPSVIDLSKQTADMVISAAQPLPESHTYRQVLLADLNDDGFDDIIVGAWGWSYGMFLYDDEGPWDKGWIIAGRAQLPSDLSLPPTVAKPLHHDVQERNEPTVLRMAPSELKMIFGAGIAAGDVTGDGIKDLVLNVFKERGPERELRRPCLLPGHSDFFANKSGHLLTQCQFISGSLSLDTANPYSTQPLFIGDFNGDQRDDVFLRLADPVFVIRGLLGRVFPGSNININLNDTVTIFPPKLKDSTYYPIFIQMTLGDVNGDQHADLFLVEPLGGEKTDGHIGPGAVYVVFGRKVSRESDLKKENIP